jgi:hypothetical protein
VGRVMARSLLAAAETGARVDGETEMGENDPQRLWHRKWLVRSLLLIGFGLAILCCALLVPSTKEFDPDIPSELDDDERVALLGIIAVSVGIGMTLICAIAWLVTRVRRAVRKSRE